MGKSREVLVAKSKVGKNQFWGGVFVIEKLPGARACHTATLPYEPVDRLL